MEIFKEITMILNAAWPYVALAATLYCVIYDFLKNNHLVQGNAALDRIYIYSKNAVLNQDRYADLSGEQKFENAVRAVREMCDKAGVKTTDANVVGSVQRAYQDTKTQGLLQNAKPESLAIKDADGKVQATINSQGQVKAKGIDDGKTANGELPDAPVEVDNN